MVRAVDEGFSALQHEPCAPKIAAHTLEAGPDETIFLTGSGLDGAEFRIGYFAPDGTLRTHRMELQVVTATYAMVSIPYRIPKTLFFLWAGKDGRWSEAARINVPQPWWIYPDDPRPGQTVRLFGRELAVLPGYSFAHVFLESETGPAIHLIPKASGRWEIKFELPRDIQPGKYKIWSYAGTAGKYGWGEPISLTVQPSAEMILNPPLDITEFGIKGDGLTDDTKSLQAALDAAAEQRRPIRLPKGRFLVLSPLTIKSHVQLTGESRDGTVILCENRHPAPQVGFTVGEITDPWCAPRPKIYEWDFTATADGDYHLWLRHTAELYFWTRKDPSEFLSFKIDNGEWATFQDCYLRPDQKFSFEWRKIGKVRLTRGKHVLKFRNTGADYCYIQQWVFTDRTDYDPQIPGPGNSIVIEGEELSRFDPMNCEGHGNQMVARCVSSKLEGKHDQIFNVINREGFINVIGSDVSLEKLSVLADWDSDWTQAVSIRPVAENTRVDHILLKELELSAVHRGVHVQKADHVTIEDCRMTSGFLDGSTAGICGVPLRVAILTRME
jgi:hypothetical protein